MSCCGGKIPTEINIQNVPYDQIILGLRQSLLKFDIKEGKFKQVENKNPQFKPKQSKAVNKGEAEMIRLEIGKKNSQIEMLRETINEIKQKKEKLREMLKVDIAEKEYLEEMKENIGSFRDNSHERNSYYQKDENFQSRANNENILDGIDDIDIQEKEDEIKNQVSAELIKEVNKIDNETETAKVETNEKLYA